MQSKINKHKMRFRGLLQTVGMQNNPADSLNASNLKNRLAQIVIGSYSRIINHNLENGRAYYQRGNWYQTFGREAIAFIHF
jgi:hypothetical protein